ncbi:MAG: glycosyltransferase [Candidatus Saccharibacteria bacterium]
MKVALIHDVLNQLGGAEKVLKNFLEIWPDATIHTVFYDEAKTGAEFKNFSKKVSPLDKFPLSHSHPRLFVTLLPIAFGRFKFDDYDLVFSDSSAFAKFANAGEKLHICYCHTPTRFLWTEPNYLKRQSYPEVLKWLGSLFMPYLRRRDFAAAQRPDFFIANSVNVQNRIRKFYHRDSVVIPPPVDTGAFRPAGGSKSDYYFVASRLEPYKKIELVIQAFNKLGLPLKVAGSGTIIEQLRAMAGNNIEFLGRVSDVELKRRYSEAKAFIFPAEEDAGIMVLEAQACGTPVIAYGAGGALETVIEGVTGEFFREQTAESLEQVVRRFEPAKYDPLKIRENALKYDKSIFQQRIREFVEEKYREFRQTRKG